MKKLYLIAAAMLASCGPFAAFGVTVTFESNSATSAILNSVGSSKITSGSPGGLSGSLGGKPDAKFTNNTLSTVAGYMVGPANPAFNLSVYFQAAKPTSNAGGTLVALGLS